MAQRQKNAPKITTALLHRAEEAPHFHQDLELLYLMEGTLTVTQDGKETTLQKDDVLVINCNHTHSLHSAGELTLLQVQVAYALLEEIAPGEEPFFFCNSAVDAYHPYGEVRRLMRQLLLSYAGGRRRTEAVRYSYVYALLDLLTEHFRRAPEPVSDGRPPQDEERLQAIISYVNRNFRDQINLGKLAEQMYLSTSSLSRLFKRSMGCYFADFVNHVRLNQAVQELASTDKTVTRIAADCGFTNLAAFNKQFQAAYHTTPAAWRKQQWEEQDPAVDDRQLEALAQDIEKLHLEAEPAVSAPGAQSLAVMVQTGPGTPYTHSWNRVLNGGAAHELTICNVQGHIVYLCEHLGFRFVRIWNLFSRSMMIARDTAQSQYNFDRLDNVLDFMVSSRMVPYLDFGQRPVCAVKAEGQMVYYENEGLDFASSADWLRMFRAFIDHIARRYGREAAGSWVYDFSLDIRQQTLPFCKDKTEMWELYRQATLCLRQHFPGVSVGGLGGIPVGDLAPMVHWLEFCKANDCVPDHLSVLVFPYRHEAKEGDYEPRRLAREGEEARQIHRCRALLDKLGLPDCRVFAVEWNSTLSTRNWLNDSCFRAAYALDVFNRTWGEADAIGVWMATDWCCSYYDTTHIANGGNGLLSKDGIRKPIYHALDFLNRMGPNLLQKGDCYIATASGPDDFYLLCYNCKRYSYEYFRAQENDLDLHRLPDLFEDDRDLQIRFTLSGLSEHRSYALKRRVVNEEHGSLLGEWSRFEYDADLDARDVQYLRNVCNPELSMRKQRSEKGSISFTATLKPHEVALYHIFAL